MKKKTLAYLLLGVMAISGCKLESSSSKTPSTGGNPSTPSSSVTPSSPSTPSNPSTPSTPSTPVTPGIEHLPPLTREIENPSKTREYNSNYDEMLEDFSTNGNVKSALRVMVDSADNGEGGFFPNSPDGAIYKVAGQYGIEAYEGIGFRIRKVGEGTLDYSNLILALRGDDAYNTYPISLADALDTDAEALPELTNEYQDIVIAPGQTIEDDTTEYESKSGGSSGVKVLDIILGFHLYATGECAQMIEIEEVFLMNAGEKFVIDNFNRTDVNKKDDLCWWRGSKGFIVRKGMKLQDSKVTVNADVGDYENIGLTVFGDTTGTTIAPVTASGVGTAINWSDLKDADGNTVSNAVNGAYYSLTANFENSGISTTDLVGFEISSTSEVYFSEIFLTNFKEKEAITEYPKIDAENASMFDNFNRTQSGFNGDYDASSSNQVVLDAGLDYALSYNNGDKVSVDNGHVTFDATNLASNDYINFKEGNDGAYKGEKYMVLSVKMEDGATLDNFRFDAGDGNVTYVNQMVSASGLPVPMAYNAEYPYTTEDGYTWLVVDLAESGMRAGAYIDFYYSGTGKLLIDAVFYANEYVRYNEIETFNLSAQDLSGYAYIGYIYGAPQAKYIRATFTSTTEGQTLKSIRFGTGNGEHWFKDGLVKDINGNAISGDTVIPEGGLTVIIDIEASGMALGDIHVHGGGFDGSSGDITITATTMALKEYDEIETFNLSAQDLSGYAYIGYIYGAPQAKYIRATFTSTTEGQTLKSIRFGTGNGEHWFKDGLVKDINGNAISGDTVIPEGGLTVIIDIEASGMALGDIHVHGGGFDGSSGDITIAATTLTVTSYSDLISGLTQ